MKVLDKLIPLVGFFGVLVIALAVVIISSFWFFEPEHVRVEHRAPNTGKVGAMITNQILSDLMNLAAVNLITKNPDFDNKDYQTKKHLAETQINTVITNMHNAVTIHMMSNDKLHNLVIDRAVNMQDDRLKGEANEH